MASSLRTVSRLVQGMKASDGAGVKLLRVIGQPKLDMLDPFLLLDYFEGDASDMGDGFPDHPHRGFETVSVLLEGSMRHADHCGNKGLLTAGSIQWMTAGRGIVHSEMPAQSEGRLRGFQLWSNLPASHKMMAPRYQDIPPEAVPLVDVEPGVVVKVMAGLFADVTGPVKGVITQPTYLLVELAAGARFRAETPRGHNFFAFVHEGAIAVGPTEVPERHIAVLDDGDAFEAVGGASGGKFIFVGAAPIGEPVARSGPFVMNTREELMQAYRDYSEGRLGRPE
eukprot:Amastigsp_a511965_34.p1 type:complete len:282 gc:universal Amastigsp_a511965_34:911-66(-)